MRATVIAVIVLLLMSAAAPQSKRRPRPDTPAEAQSRTAEDQAAIQKLQDKDILASTAFDVEALLALWTDDGVLLAPQHAPVSGKAALRRFYEQQREALGRADIIGYEEQWQEVRIMGDYAYQWGQIQQRTRIGQSRAESSTLVNAMRILKRDEDGAWRVARAIYNEARASTTVGTQPAPAGKP